VGCWYSYEFDSVVVLGAVLATVWYGASFHVDDMLSLKYAKTRGEVGWGEVGLGEVRVGKGEVGRLPVLYTHSLIKFHPILIASMYLCMDSYSKVIAA
jgi:hypothetical protein